MLYVHVESSRPIEAHHQQPDYFLAQGPFAGDQILSWVPDGTRAVH